MKSAAGQLNPLSFLPLPSIISSVSEVATCIEFCSDTEDLQTKFILSQVTHFNMILL